LAEVALQYDIPAMYDPMRRGFTDPQMDDNGIASHTSCGGFEINMDKVIVKTMEG
jgi:hypothetical protein